MTCFFYCSPRWGAHGCAWRRVCGSTAGVEQGGVIWCAFDFPPSLPARARHLSLSCWFYSCVRAHASARMGRRDPLHAGVGQHAAGHGWTPRAAIAMAPAAHPERKRAGAGRGCDSWAGGHGWPWPHDYNTRTPAVSRRRAQRPTRASPHDLLPNDYRSRPQRRRHHGNRRALTLLRAQATGREPYWRGKVGGKTARAWRAAYRRGRGRNRRRRRVDHGRNLQGVCEAWCGVGRAGAVCVRVYVCVYVGDACVCKHTCTRTRACT